MERSSIAAITVVAVTIAIFILLTLTICLLVCYHRRVSKHRHGECFFIIMIAVKSNAGVCRFCKTYNIFALDDIPHFP